MDRLFQIIQRVGKFKVLIQGRDIADKAITDKKISNGAVVWDKLSSDVKDMITASDDVIIGVSNDILRVGVTASVIVRAYSFAEAQQIHIKRNGITIASGSGHELVYTDEITPFSHEDITYTAEVVIGDGVRQKNAIVHVVSPIYYGAGQTYSTAMTAIKTQISPSGEYVFSVGQDGGYLFVMVPDTMTIHNATFNGLTLPLEEPQHTIISGLGYNVYKSSNEYDEGVMTVLIG